MRKINRAAMVIGASLFAGTVTAGCTTSTGSTSEIGSTLNDKTAMSLAEAPAGAVAAAQARRPDLAFREAEVEQRNGVRYVDIEGVDAEGQEIELDVMEGADGWVVVEVQRDVVLAQTPDAVRASLADNAPGVTPDRIIESDQGDGVIIYEFFTRSTSDEEAKYEVKWDGAEAAYLTEEWVH